MKVKLVFGVVVLLFIGCTTSENKANSDQNLDSIAGNELPSCEKIEQYPVHFSFASDSLKKELLTKIKKPLSTSQKEALFKFEDKDIPSEIFNQDFDVFTVNEIRYEKATLVVYIVIEPQTEYFNESDQIVLVLYDENGIPSDIMSGVLEDVYGSTYEVVFSSPYDFTVTYTDHEYSPDPESEAEDIANGVVFEPSAQVYTHKVKDLKFD